MRTLDADRDARLLASSRDARAETDELILEIRQTFRQQTRVLIAAMFVCTEILMVVALARLRP